MSDGPEISQDAARALLHALKALMGDMKKISGTTYTFDSYRHACLAVALAEGSATVRDVTASEP